MPHSCWNILKCNAIFRFPLKQACFNEKNCSFEVWSTPRLSGLRFTGRYPLLLDWAPVARTFPGKSSFDKQRPRCVLSVTGWNQFTEDDTFPPLLELYHWAVGNHGYRNWCISTTVFPNVGEGFDPRWDWFDKQMQAMPSDGVWTFLTAFWASPPPAVWK